MKYYYLKSIGASILTFLLASGVIVLFFSFDVLINQLKQIHTIFFLFILATTLTIFLLPLFKELENKKTLQNNFIVKVWDRETFDNVIEYPDVFQFDLFDNYAYINGLIKIPIEGKQFELKKMVSN